MPESSKEQIFKELMSFFPSPPYPSPTAYSPEYRQPCKYINLFQTSKWFPLSSCFSHPSESPFHYPCLELSWLQLLTYSLHLPKPVSFSLQLKNYCSMWQEASMKCGQEGRWPHYSMSGNCCINEALVIWRGRWIACWGISLPIFNCVEGRRWLW